MIYVLDASALAVICSYLDDVTEGLEAMTEMVSRGELVFCDDVVKQIEIICRGEMILLWARSCKAQLRHKTADFGTQALIVRLVPGVVDDGAEESPEICALAQAHHLHESFGDAILVTNDFGTKFSRLSVEDAAASLEFGCMRAVDFATLI